MSYILITGAGGFIGRWIADALIKELGPKKVIGVDDLSSGGELSSRLEYSYVGDLRDKAFTDSLFTFPIDTVYHLAANDRESASFFQPASVVSRNSGAFVNVMSSALAAGGLERLILFSSISVYGKQEPPFTEEMDKKPVDIYGLEKAKMEDMTEMLATAFDFDYVIFRPHNVFGEYSSLRDPFRNVIGIWMNQIMRGEPMTIFGDGEQECAFTYINDIIDVFVRAGDRGHGVFNVGCDIATTINHAAAVVQQAMGAGPDYPIVRVGDRHNEVHLAYSDHSKLQNHWDCPRLSMVDFANGVGHMARWAMRQGPQQWRVGDPLEIDDAKVPAHWRDLSRSRQKEH